MNSEYNEKILDTANPKYDRIFWNAMRGHHNILKAQDIGRDESGMYLMPLGSSKRYNSKLLQRSALRDICTVIDSYDSPYDFIARDSLDRATWIPEGAEIPLTDGMHDFDTTKSKAKKLASIVKLDKNFLNDYGFNIEEYLTDRLSRTFARGEDYGFINGDGIGSPFGILHPEHGASTAIETDAITYSDILSVFFALDPEYRDYGTWMMNDETAQDIRELKDDAGNYIWNESSGTLLGKPVRISNAMPSAESGECPVVFGDFSYYWIVVRKPLTVRVLNELYALDDKMGYLGIEMLDGFLIRRKAMQALLIK